MRSLLLLMLVRLYSVNAAGRLFEAAGSDGGGTHFAYDGDGRVLPVEPDAGDEVVMILERGDLNRRVSVGYLWGDSRGDSFTVSDRGKLKTCTRSP